MKASVARWGDCLAIRLPETLVERNGLREGDVLEIAFAREQMVVTVREQYSIEQLIAGMTPENSYGELFPHTVGREMW